MSSKKQKKQMLPLRHSIFWRVLRSSVFTVMLLIVALSTVSYLFMASFIQKQVLTQLTSVVSNAEEELQDRIQKSRITASTISSSLRGTYNFEAQVPYDDNFTFSELFKDLQEKNRSLTSMYVYTNSGDLLGGGGDELSLPTPPPTRTVLIPIIGQNGWEGYDIVSPITGDSGNVSGWVVVRYDTQSVLAELASAASVLGKTGTMALGAVENGELILLQHSTESRQAYASNIGSIQQMVDDKRPLALATIGNEGIGKFTDHNGNSVFTSFRYMPDLGWGLMVKIGEHEALAGAYELANLMGIVGLLFALASVIIAYSMTKQLTDPLIRLSKNVSLLSPGSWNYKQSVFSKDEIERLDVVIVDLTQRLRGVYENLEAEVQKRTERLKKEFTKDRTILQSLTIGLIVVGPDGNIQEANPSALNMLKAKESDIIGVEATELLEISEHQKQIEPEKNPIHLCLKKKEDIKISPDTHLNISRKDNTQIAVQMSVSPLLQDDELQGAIILFRDVTTERQIDYMKTEFITLASHQLRTPLSAIQWYLELLSSDNENLTDDQKEFIVELRLSARRMSNIVGELMDASRLQKGGVEPILKTVNLKKFIGNITDDLKGVASEKGITCHSDLPSDPILIKSDPMLLSIVMQNLISNAIKYSTKDGKVRIVLTHTGSDVMIQVKDTGIGIPHADQEHIFQKLYRAHNARKLDVNGSGLGLYSSKNILEKLGGDIVFESKEDEGSTFTVSFPGTRIVKSSSKSEEEDEDDQ